MVEPPPTHTPYDGSSKLFTIGLKPLDLADWIEVDRHYAAHIAEKRRLYDTIPELVFVEEDRHARCAARGARLDPGSSRRQYGSAVR